MGTIPKKVKKTTADKLIFRLEERVFFFAFEKGAPNQLNGRHGDNVTYCSACLFKLQQ